MSPTEGLRTIRDVARTPLGIIASGFWIGFLPFAPGTWASAAILPIGWFVGDRGGYAALLLSSLAVFCIGIWASHYVVRQIKVEDPSVVVIDEFAGQLLTLAATSLTMTGVISAFLLFRLFDVLKPWPASWADRELAGGLGAMTDDIIAGAYAAAIILGLRYLGWL